MSEYQSRIESHTLDRERRPPAGPCYPVGQAPQPTLTPHNCHVCGTPWVPAPDRGQIPNCRCHQTPGTSVFVPKKVDRRSEVMRRQDAIRRLILRVNTNRATFYPLVGFVGWMRGGVMLDFPTSCESLSYNEAISALVKMKRSTKTMPCGDPVQVHGPFIGHCSPCHQELGTDQ